MKPAPPLLQPLAGDAWGRLSLLLAYCQYTIANTKSANTRT